MGNPQRIIVGIDFGTTYSSVAWAFQTFPEDVELLSEWPGGGNKTSLRVPTTISYENDKILWGHQTGSVGEVIRGMKLLLDPTQEVKYTPAIQSEAILEKYAKVPLDVARDYLQLLLAKWKEVLERRFGKATKSMDIQYVMTVPAVWTDKAKNLTLTAATQAGIFDTDITLVSEPEAAALYCLKEIQPNTIKDGDVVLVCNASGGTVDLISYCVKTVNPLQLEEATEGTGGICGSILLDERFEAHLIGVLGEQKYQSLPQRSRDMAMRAWQEDIKPNFAGVSGDEDDDYSNVDYYVPLVGVGDKRKIGLESGFLTLSKSNVELIFSAVADEVEALVQDLMLKISQAGKRATAIFLVGGFGSSEYLFRRLRSATVNVTVMQPPNAGSAAVRGAVLRGLGGNLVDKRIAQRHYGVAFRVEYDPRLHDRADRCWDDLEEKWYVNERMRWYIRKGDPISENEPIKMTWNRNVENKKAGKRLSRAKSLLYICNLDEAPDHITDDVFRVCTLEVDLRAIPRSLIELRTNSKGEKYYKFGYQIAMTLTSTSILFNLEFRGVSYGSVKARY